MAVPDQADWCSSSRARARWPWRRRSRTSCATATRRSSSAAASSASAGAGSPRPTASSASTSTSSGARASTRTSVAAALDKDPAIRAVYATASETSTGVKHDVEGLSKMVRGRPDVLLCVDAITAIGVFDVPMDEWGLDVVVPRLAEGAHAAARPGDGRRVRQGLEGERAREPAALLHRPRARAEEPGEGRDRLHARGVADRRAARVAAHAEGGDARGRLRTATSAWPRRRAPRPAASGSSCSRRRRPTR